MKHPRRLVYLGGKLGSRAYNEIKELQTGKLDTAFEIVFFPSLFKINLKKSKQRVPQEGRSVIWNVFKVPYNQSGVTLDALRYGVPVILSDHDNQL